MRNIFDQYRQPENQLTHALVCALASDQYLLKKFLKEIAKTRWSWSPSINIQEQTLPGDAELPEPDAERRGLPDAVIHDENNWCLAIESKVAASPNINQLRRHRNSIERRGFTSIEVLLITASPSAVPFQSVCQVASWGKIYSWLRGKAHRSDWARRMAEYLEIQEQRLVDSGYLREGALTEFSGFDFGPDRPYNYYEAKRLLRLAMHELRGITTLRDKLGADLGGGGRSAITGREGSSVWDFIPLLDLKTDRFNKSPHLTLSISSERVFAFLTLPSGMVTPLSNNLRLLGYDSFCDIVLEVEARLRSITQRAPGAAPWLRGLQRRYPSQRSLPIEDACIEFDLRTALPQSVQERSQSIKLMPEWLRAAYSAWGTKRTTGANYQIAIGASFPFSRCPSIREPDAVRLVADTWLACDPMLRTIRGEGKQVAARTTNEA